MTQKMKNWDEHKAEMDEADRVLQPQGFSLAVDRRVEQARALRTQGWSYKRIGYVLAGYSATTARRWCKGEGPGRGEWCKGEGPGRGE